VRQDYYQNVASQFFAHFQFNTEEFLNDIFEKPFTRSIA